MSSNTSKRQLFVASTGCLILGIAIGWIAQSALNQTNSLTGSSMQAMDKDVLTAIAQLNAPATISVDQELGLVTVKGSKEDVEQTNRMIALVRQIAENANAPVRP